MTMLIRGGRIVTMTSQGTRMGDVLIRDGQIEAIAEKVDPGDAADCCCLDARGLTLLPGVIDASARSHACSQGVTAALLRPEQEGICLLHTSHGTQESHFYAIQQERYTDAQLHACILALAHAGDRPVCEVRGEQACRRLLGMIHSTGVKVMLTGLQGCAALAEAIALAHAPVVANVEDDGALLARLAAEVACFAITCTDADGTPCNLRRCMAVCARAGLPDEVALGTVTNAPARLLGLPNRGSLAPGAVADIVLCAGAAPADFTHVLTIANGKIKH